MSTATHSERTRGESPQAEPSAQQGMGALPHESGVAFRVWAPHADAVQVVGTFNEWAEDAHPLAPEGEGYWSAAVAEAQVGDHYRFIIRNGDQVLERNDPYARHTSKDEQCAIVHDPAFDWEGDDFQMAPWEELVIYELHIGTFNEQSVDTQGTLENGRKRLGYLQRLGINAIELMPVAEFPGPHSWGYNLTYPFAVEQSYGGPDALKRFVKEAHERGIAVLMDVVYTHFGPSDLDLWRFDGWHEDGWGGLFFYNDKRAETPWGDTRPDFSRPEVRRYIRDNVMMWLDEYHLDGLRGDGTVFIRKTSFSEDADDLPEGRQMMREINQEVHERLPGKLLIAEDLQDDPAVTEDAEADGLDFDMQWDASFVHPIRALLISPRDEERDLETVRACIEHRFNHDVFERIIYTESHDEVANGKARVPYEINPEEPDSWASQKRSTLGAALVFTVPGVPMLFQGQEFLEEGWFSDEEALDWRKLEEENGIYRLYRDLIALRRNQRGTTRGLRGQQVDVYHLNHDAKVLAFRRWSEGGPGDETVVLVNLANRSYGAYRVGFPHTGRWHVRFNSDWDGYSDDFGGHPADDVEAAAEPMHEQPASAAVSIGPYTVLIFSQGDAGDEHGPGEAEELASPLADYDELTVREVKKRLDDLSEDEIRRLQAYEQEHKNRKTLLRALDRKLNRRAET